MKHQKSFWALRYGPAMECLWLEMSVLIERSIQKMLSQRPCAVVIRYKMEIYMNCVSWENIFGILCGSASLWISIAGQFSCPDAIEVEHSPNIIKWWWGIFLSFFVSSSYTDALAAAHTCTSPFNVCKRTDAIWLLVCECIAWPPSLSADNWCLLSAPTFS